VQQNWVAGIVGSSRQVAHEDHQHSAFPSPDSWVVYCVDYDGVVLNGNDATAQPGYSFDTSVIPPAAGSGTLAQALALSLNTPFKTLERVGQLLPRDGNNANLVVLVAKRLNGVAYRNMANTADQDSNWMNAIVGWKSVVIRGTGNTADAPNIAFTNTIADKRVAGYMTLPSTFLSGYNTIAGSTTLSLTCQKVGGGSAALPAESGGVSAISGYRIRFSATTPTVALQNWSTMIYKNTTTVITPAEQLPAVPAANDVFFIEQPGFAVGSFSHSVSQGTSPGIVVSGLRSTGTGGTVLAGNGCEQHAGVFLADYLTSGILFHENYPTYSDETGTDIRVGTSLFCAGFEVADTFTTMVVVATVGIDSLTFIASTGAFIGLGSFLRGGLFVTSVGGAETAPNGIIQIGCLGTGGTSVGGGRPPRITQTVVGAPGAITITSTTGCAILSATVANSTVPVVAISTVGGAVSIDGISSPDGGNTDVVLDVSLAVKTTVRIGAIQTVTATAAQGDIRLSGGALGLFSNLASNNLPDSGGNDVVGSAGAVSTNGVTCTVSGSANLQPFQPVQMLSSGQIGPAQANNSGNAAGVLGICLTVSPAGSQALVVTGGPVSARFHGANPTPGHMAYLSATDSTLSDGVPGAVACPMGIVIRDGAGSLAVVNLIPSPALTIKEMLTVSGRVDIAFDAAITAWLGEGVNDYDFTQPIEYNVDKFMSPLGQPTLVGFDFCYRVFTAPQIASLTVNITANGTVISTTTILTPTFGKATVSTVTVPANTTIGVQVATPSINLSADIRGFLYFVGP
jgi:hypothetical protein